MAKRRMLHDRFWTSQNNLRWTMRQRLLFIGIISTADDQGRTNAHPALVRSAVFPYDDITLEDVRLDLEAIAATEAIMLYEADGMPIVQVTNWWNYQQPQWAQPSALPAPDGWADRIRYRRDSTVFSCNWVTPKGEAMPDNCDANGKPLPGANGEPLRKALPKGSPKPLTYAPSDSDSDSDSDSKERDGASAPVRRKRRQSVPPAVAVMREEMQRYPLRATYQEIADAVGEDQAALDRWRDVCRQWARRGYNVGNVEGLLDAYNAGGLAPRKGNGNHADPPQVTLTGTDSGFAYGEIERILERQRAEEAATCKV